MYMQWTTSKSIKNWDKLRRKMKSSQRQKQHKSMISWISKKKFDSRTKRLIMDNINQRYEEGEDVNVENLIPDLSPELQKDVKRHICLPLLKNVSFITSFNLLSNCIIIIWKKRIVLLINYQFYDHTSRLKQLAWLVYFFFYESDEIFLKY